MVMPNFLFCGLFNDAPSANFLPDNAALGVSDYCGVSIDASKIRFTRPTVDGQGFEYAAPGARIRFSTDSTSVLFRLQYTNLVTRPDTYNAVGLILSNGVVVATFTRKKGSAGPLNVFVKFGSAAMRTIEIVMPYCASVDFTGLYLMTDATLQVAPTRPSTRYVAMGDSITHGFAASDIGEVWAYKLAVAKGWQLVSHGYGGRQVDASDGATLAALSPSVATYLVGYNNFYSQTPLASFKSEFKSFVSSFRAVNATAKLYCITPTWSPNTFGSLTLEMYRQQIRDALTEIGSALNVLIEGESLATNSTTRFPDSVHPNDLGATEIAAALQSAVNL